MDVFTAATLAALVVKVTSALKYLTSGQWRDAASQAVAWAVGIAAVWLAANANVADGLVVWGELTLGQLDVGSIVLAGLALGSFGSFSYDFKRAVDGSDSASEPPLIGP